MIRAGQPFRPWGKVDNIFSAIPNSDWAYIGCVSAEDRCSIMATYFPQFGHFSEKLVFCISDKPSEATAEIRDKTDAHQTTFKNCNFAEADFFSANIFDTFGTYEDRINTFFTDITSTRLLLDISTLPKKVFFHIVRQIYRNAERFSDVVVTYAEPAEYCEGNLASNPEPWDALPGFRVARRQVADLKILVGIGFEPLGLPSLVESGEFNNSPISFLFPFPADQSSNAKNWRFIRDIFPNAEQASFKVKRVDGSNVPEIFDLICGEGDSGNIDLLLAPYGPKPMSLAMALYAAKYSNPPNSQTGVYYTQPTYYDPNYSVGVKIQNGKPVINCYVIRADNQNLY